MSELNDFDGTEQPQDSNLDNKNANTVNPGVIRKSTTQSILNALSNASGEKFDSVEAAIGYIARVNNLKPNSGGTAQPEDEAPKQRSRITANDLQEQFVQLRQELVRKDLALKERDLENEIVKSMGDRFDTDLMDYALTKVKSNIQWNDDGSYSIVDSRGRERYGMDGSPLTIRSLVDEVAKGNPKLLKQAQTQGGSGLRTTGGMFAGAQDDEVPDYSRDPAAFNAWASKNGLGKRVGLKAVGVSASNSSGSKKIL